VQLYKKAALAAVITSAALTGGAALPASAEAVAAPTHVAAAPAHIQTLGSIQLGDGWGRWRHRHFRYSHWRGWHRSWRYGNSWRWHRWHRWHRWGCWSRNCWC